MASLLSVHSPPPPHKESWTTDEATLFMIHLSPMKKEKSSQFSRVGCSCPHKFRKFLAQTVFLNLCIPAGKFRFVHDVFSKSQNAMCVLHNSFCDYFTLFKSLATCRRVFIL
jgi:hypothetical protein